VNAEREAVAAGLEKMAARLRGDASLPLPGPHWPLVFRAGDGADLDALAASLGVTAGTREDFTEEDGTPWQRLQGSVGGVPVELTAGTGAVVLDPLTDDGVVDSTYAGVA
jgi:hypothetical protein